MACPVLCLLDNLSLSALCPLVTIGIFHGLENIFPVPPQGMHRTCWAYLMPLFLQISFHASFPQKLPLLNQMLSLFMQVPHYTVRLICVGI